MARINRSDVIQKAVNDLAISTATEKVPNETLDKVQLTYDLNKNISNFIFSGSSTSTGTLTVALPSISPTADIYLTGVCFSIIKDATCDIADGSIVFTVVNDTSTSNLNLLRIANLTLTAQNETIHASFPFPIKVKNGSSVTIPGTFTVGKLIRVFSATGYYTTSN